MHVKNDMAKETSKDNFKKWLGQLEVFGEIYWEVLNKCFGPFPFLSLTGLIFDNCFTKVSCKEIIASFLDSEFGILKSSME